MLGALILASRLSLALLLVLLLMLLLVLVLLLMFSRLLLPPFHPEQALAGA